MSSGPAIWRLLLLLSLLALGGVVFWSVEWLPLRVAAPEGGCRRAGGFGGNAAVDRHP